MRPPDLRARRLALHLSQAGLGRALGVSRNTVARWERGELEIRHADLVTLALDRLGNNADRRPVGRPTDDPPNNLPLELSSFIGRENEVAEVRTLLGRTRL